LRFWGLCIRFLWVFKFFFGFLLARRSAWTNALHSFHSALGKIDAPFFGAPKKEKRERAERYAILRSWWFCRARRRVLSAEVRPGKGVWCGLVDTGPGWRVYVVSRPVCI
jgi:hypothetical protein